MFIESIKSFSTPLFIYVVMGIFIARIQLAQVNRKGYNWLKWTQFAVDLLRIVLMWPLVLFIEKSKSWLETPAGLEETTPVNAIVLNETAK